jgi:regulatory protein
MQPQSKTFALALKLLKARDRFESELRGKLAASSSPSSEIDEAISALKALGYIDDARHTLTVAAWLSRTKLWGRRRIAAELRHRGAPKKSIPAAIESLPEDSETASLLARKTKREGPALARRLAAAGYDYTLIRELSGLD